MTTTLTREDTGEMAVVRVASRNYLADMHTINDHYGALIDRAVHSVTQRVHRAYDEAIAEALDGARLPEPWPTADALLARQAARIEAGTYQWAELPEREWKPGDPLPLPPLPDEAYPPGATPLPDPVRAYFDADTSDELPGREVRGDGIPVLEAAYHGERGERGGWTPEKPLPALMPRSQVQAGPRWRPLRRLDDLFARADAWLKRKRAATAKRMGLDAPARPAGHDESGQ